MCVTSTLKVNRLLHEFCRVYLALGTDKSSSKVTMDSVSVVREFSDVFPKELPGLPPDQKLEFKTKLLSGSAPISIPLYRMALAE